MTQAVAKTLEEEGPLFTQEGAELAGDIVKRLRAIPLEVAQAGMAEK